jgi:hypothetical protein
MVNATQGKAQALGLANVHVEQRDFVVGGTGLPDTSVGYVMMFNILHCEQPLLLLSEAKRILVEGGLLGIMHWNYDPTTPRGPSMDIRPRPEQCLEWATQAGFALHGPARVDVPPYHYGFVGRK